MASPLTYRTGTPNSRAYYKTQTRSRTVVAFNFDPEGVVNEVVNYDLANAMDIALIERETPTKGKELSVLEQLIGNVGALPTQNGPQTPSDR